MVSGAAVKNCQAHPCVYCVAFHRCMYILGRAGGVLFGDDFGQTTSGVAQAVRDGSKQLGVEFRLAGRYWIIERPERAKSGVNEL